ncbi:MAG: prepilin peptidase [Acetatifactor sp.]|nr:prepilin peptidase [Acetatifactor sp.]
MIVLCLFLCIACFFDYRKARIPNWLPVLIYAAGGCRGLVLHGLAETVPGIIAGIGWILLLYPLFRIGVLGAGDIKLYGACAIYFSFLGFCKFFIISMLFAAMISLFKIIYEQNGLERMKYFFEYVEDVCRNHAFKLYFRNESDRVAAGICMSGPTLLAALLFLGGVC